MGAFDSFSDKAEEVGRKAKDAAGNGKRNRSGEREGREQAERGARQEGRERRPGHEDEARRRMGQEPREGRGDNLA